MTEPTLPEGDDAPVENPAAMPSPAAPAPAGAPRKPFMRRNWGKLSILFLILAPVAVFGIWAGATLSYTYSSGKRAGFVQKFSSKGWLCKTWEGTLYTDIAKGFRSDSFNFSVRNDSLARVLQEMSGKRVAVAYEQHVGVPTSCFGETEYFVVGVEEIPD